MSLRKRSPPDWISQLRKIRVLEDLILGLLAILALLAVALGYLLT
jgi:hypothetical protein